jgi:hypothetical protein
MIAAFARSALHWTAIDCTPRDSRCHYYNSAAKELPTLLREGSFLCWSKRMRKLSHGRNSAVDQQMVDMTEKGGV